MQLHIYDTGYELQNGLFLFLDISSIDQTIVHNLIDMFNSHNQIVKSFRMARVDFKE